MQYDGTKSVARSRHQTLMIWSNSQQTNGKMKTNPGPASHLFLSSFSKTNREAIIAKAEEVTNRQTWLPLPRLGLAITLHCLDTVIIATLLQVGEQVRREAMRQVERTNWLSRQVRDLLVAQRHQRYIALQCARWEASPPFLNWQTHFCILENEKWLANWRENS